MFVRVKTYMRAQRHAIGREMGGKVWGKGYKTDWKEEFLNSSHKVRQRAVVPEEYTSRH